MYKNDPITSSKEISDLKQFFMIQIQDLVTELIENRYLSKKDTCKYLNISNNTLDNWIKLGLPVIRINGVLRFDRLAIDNWLEKRV